MPFKLLASQSETECLFEFFGGAIVLGLTNSPGIGASRDVPVHNIGRNQTANGSSDIHRTSYRQLRGSHLRFATQTVGSFAPSALGSLR